MARRKRDYSEAFGSIKNAINDMRTGMNDVDKSIERKELAKWARILGFVMLIAAILYLLSTLRYLHIL